MCILYDFHVYAKPKQQFWCFMASNYYHENNINKEKSFVNRYSYGITGGNTPYVGIAIQ
jgi:hypothetical protein